MKKVSEELRYDGSTLDEVHEMLATPAFREEVCDSQGVLRHSVEINSDGKGMTVVIDQIQAAQGLPGFARKVVGDEINIVQSEDWTTKEKGKIQLVIPGKPGEITGTALLTEDPDGTTETVNLTAKVNIPFVGGKIEGLITDLISKGLREEKKVGRAWLDGNR